VRWLRLGAILLVLDVLESEMPAVLRPFGAGPDLLLALVLALALHADSWRVFGVLWGVGLLRDATGLGPFGLHAILLGGGGMILHLLRESLFRHHVLTLAITGAAASLVLGLAALLRLVLAGGTLAAVPALGRILAGALLTGAIAPVLVRGLLRSRALAGFVGEREMESTS
jgi:cell shape-determining protein MreD